jgi:putative 4-mercaptohistidine N1-methyltranferase
MANPYESANLVSEYLFFHYAGVEETIGDLPVPAAAWGFPTKVVREIMDCKSQPARALDIGCSVGASAFELARHVPHVLGIDYSEAFIEVAQILKESGRITGDVCREAKIRQSFEVAIPPEIDRSRVSFEVGDATCLRADLGTFDVVLAANLICRLPQPSAFLARLPDLVSPGGQLLLATPFSWLESFTPESNWIGGSVDGISSESALEKILSPHFIKEIQINIPFLIREHARKFQYGISLGTRWRRR